MVLFTSNSKVVLILISVIFFYGIIIFAFDIEKIIFIIQKINLIHYLLIFPITGLTLIIQGWRYQITLKKIGIELSFKDSFLVYLTGLSMTLTPGGAGSIIKSYYLKIKTGKTLSKTSPIILYEKWLELVAIVVLIGFLLIPVSLIESKIIFLIGVILCALFYCIFKNSIGINFLNIFLSKIKFLKVLQIKKDEFLDSTNKLTQAKTILQLLSITFLSKFLPMISIFFVFNMFGDFDIFSTSQIYFTSLVAGLLTFIPGGIIITEAGLLALSINIGIDLGTATVLVLLIRILTFWFPTFIGFIALKIISKKSS